MKKGESRSSFFQLIIQHACESKQFLRSKNLLSASILKFPNWLGLATQIHFWLFFLLTKCAIFFFSEKKVLLLSVFPFCQINLTSSNSFHVLTYRIVCYSVVISNGLDLNSALKLSCLCCWVPFCSLSHLDLAGFQDSYLSSSFTRFYCFLALLPFHVDALQFCLKWIKNVFIIKNSPLQEL